MQVAMMPISESLFQDCAERAPIYDRENRFFAEDFEDLRVAGYLLMPVPSSRSGRICPGPFPVKVRGCSPLQVI